jgi:hypothetical protein
MRVLRTIREDPARRSGPQFTEEKPPADGRARSRISTAVVVLLLTFVAVLGAVVISNLIAIARGPA